MSTFDISTEAFAAAQSEFGETVRIVRRAAIPVQAVMSEKQVQTLEGDGQTVVDTVQIYADFSVADLKLTGIGSIDHGETIERKGRKYVAVQITERMGYQRVRLHQQQPIQTARAW